MSRIEMARRTCPMRTPRGEELLHVGSFCSGDGWELAMPQRWRNTARAGRELMYPHAHRDPHAHRSFFSSRSGQRGVNRLTELAGSSWRVRRGGPYWGRHGKKHTVSGPGPNLQKSCFLSALLSTCPPNAQLWLVCLRMS